MTVPHIVDTNAVIEELRREVGRLDYDLQHQRNLVMAEREARAADNTRWEQQVGRLRRELAGRHVAALGAPDDQLRRQAERDRENACRLAAENAELRRRLEAWEART
jgi:hypothetical protein